tara:strand:- start:240 stop:533 length:294 start_codon:yes stop_codon:yes gene_type:complete
MIKSVQKFVRWQLITGQLDHWTAYHLAGGAFICKVALWCGANKFEAVMTVFILGLLWEVAEYFIEGTVEVYGSYEKWVYNTSADLFVETGIAIWMVI